MTDSSSADPFVIWSPACSDHLLSSCQPALSRGNGTSSAYHPTTPSSIAIWPFVIKGPD